LVQYDDAVYRKDTETIENIKALITTAYTQMSTSMYELIEENLDAVSVGNRTQEEDDLILSR
jgi:hypothetical protein